MTIYRPKFLNVMETVSEESQPEVISVLVHIIGTAILRQVLWKTPDFGLRLQSLVLPRCMSQSIEEEKWKVNKAEKHKLWMNFLSQDAETGMEGKM